MDPAVMIIFHLCGCLKNTFYKTFFLLKYSIGVFVLYSHFHPSLIFTGMAKIGAPLGFNSSKLGKFVQILRETR
jgi:hypothetical protein